MIEYFKKLYLSILGLKFLVIFVWLMPDTSLQAAEMPTIEDALNKCKDTYPTQLQAKKRLACFDSISTPAVEMKVDDMPLFQLVLGWISTVTS